MIQVRAFALALLLVACGSSSDPNATGGHGGTSADGGSGGSGGSGVNTGGSSAAGALSGSGGGAGGAAAGSTSGGGAGGSVTSIAPFPKHIACTSDSNDVVLSDGRLYSWGNGGKGVYEGTNYAQVSAGSTDECFLLTDSTVSCADTSSMLGKAIPSGTFSEIHVADGSTSAHAACVKSTAGTLTCWGDSTNPVVSQAPTSAVTSFALNSSNGCFIGAGGAVQCWGAPIPATTSHTDFANVYTGVLFSCGITLTGDMTCWTFSSVATPKIAQLAIGAQFACGIETNGHAFCFDNQTNDPAVVQPPAGASFVEVSVGESLGSERACGIEVDGSVVCWGTAGDAYVRSPPDPIKAF